MNLISVSSLTLILKAHGETDQLAQRRIQLFGHAPRRRSWRQFAAAGCSQSSRSGHAQPPDTASATAWSCPSRFRRPPPPPDGRESPRRSRRHGGNRQLFRHRDLRHPRAPRITALRPRPRSARPDAPGVRRHRPHPRANDPDRARSRGKSTAMAWFSRWRSWRIGVGHGVGAYPQRTRRTQRKALGRVCWGRLSSVHSEHFRPLVLHEATSQVVDLSLRASRDWESRVMNLQVARDVGWVLASACRDER